MTTFTYLCRFFTLSPRAQDFAAGPCYRDVVFYAHAEPARQVDTGLYGHDHAGLKLGSISPDEVWRLVDFEPQAVAGAVDKELTETRLLDYGAGGGVDRLAGYARPDRLNRRFLAFCTIS